MKNLLFGLIATVLFSFTGSAADSKTQIVNKQKDITIENNNGDVLKVSFNIGNITNLSESQIDTLCKNLTGNINEIKDVASCTVTMVATVDVGFGSVSVSVSYTAATCELATTKAIAGLKSAVKKVLSMS